MLDHLRPQLEGIAGSACQIANVLTGAGGRRSLEPPREVELQLPTRRTPCPREGPLALAATPRPAAGVAASKPSLGSDAAGRARRRTASAAGPHRQVRLTACVTAGPVAAWAALQAAEPHRRASHPTVATAERAASAAGVGRAQGQARPEGLWSNLAQPLDIRPPRTETEPPGAAVARAEGPAPVAARPARVVGVEGVPNGHREAVAVPGTAKVGVAVGVDGALPLRSCSPEGAEGVVGRPTLGLDELLLRAPMDLRRPHEPNLCGQLADVVYLVGRMLKMELALGP